MATFRNQSVDTLQFPTLGLSVKAGETVDATGDIAEALRGVAQLEEISRRKDKTEDKAEEAQS